LARIHIQDSYNDFREDVKSYLSGKDNELEDEQREVLTHLPERMNTEKAITRLLQLSIEEFGSTKSGSSAHDVYSGIFQLEHTRKKYNDGLKRAMFQTTIEQALPSFSSDSEEHSDYLVSLIPWRSERDNVSDRFEFAFKSDVIAARLFTKIQLMTYEETVHLIDFCRLTPPHPGSTFSSRMFEVMAHHVLSGNPLAAQRIGTMFDMQMFDTTFHWTKNISPKTSVPFCNSIRRTISLVNFDVKGSYYNEAIPTGYFVRAQSPNNPLSDSFAAHCSDGGIHIWVFQMALSNGRVGSSREVELFIEAAKEHYEGSGKLVKVHVHYVLVVPDSTRLDSCSWTMPEGRKKAHEDVNVTGHCLFIQAAVRCIRRRFSGMC